MPLSIHTIFEAPFLRSLMSVPRYPSIPWCLWDSRCTVPTPEFPLASRPLSQFRDQSSPSAPVLDNHCLSISPFLPQPAAQTADVTPRMKAALPCGSPERPPFAYDGYSLSSPAWISSSSSLWPLGLSSASHPMRSGS
ncbi:hypothetical protein NMY22_g16639 [Coprinellus aureogranulatus]|nr:hypothetical protein NMY22_g16639 [Coprinellus aureogranulatus]